MKTPRKTRASHWILGAVLVIFCLPQIVLAEPVETIVDNGNAMNRVDITILGDGYTAAEMQKYRDDVQRLMTAFFNNDPFRVYGNFFNVHRIDVVSSQSGADHPEKNSFVNTALDATYNCNATQRLICINFTKANTIVSNSVAASQRDIVFVIVNDEEYGGSGGPIAVTSTHPDVLELILHELGHSFGLLADEYGGPPPPNCINNVEPSAANATKATDRALIKWNHWIDASTPLPTQTMTQGLPGIYQGAAYCDGGLYRPTFESKMRVLGQPFEQVNTEQLIKRIYNHVSPIDASEPSATEITLTTVQSQTFTVTPLVTLTESIKVDWYVDGVFQSTGAEFTAANLTSGNHVVDAVVKDNTSMVRKDTENLLIDNRTWNLNVNSAATPTPTPTPSPGPTPIQQPSPLLLLEENSNSAIAVDSVSLLRYPFPVSTVPNYSTDGQTRLMLFATNIELQSDGNFSIVTAEAEDSHQITYPLIVEYVGRVPNLSTLTQINVRLPENLANAGKVMVSIKVRGVESNKVLVNIRPPL